MMINLLLLLFMVLLSVAFLTLLERKIFSYIQFRKGPNKLFIKGLLQPISDGMKLFMKEKIMILNSNLYLYNLFSLMALYLMFLYWYNYFYNFFEMIFHSLIYVIIISSLTVYTVLGSGWSSNSKYAILGSYRSVSQTISYEINMVFMLISFTWFMNSYSIFFMKKFFELSLMLTWSMFFMLIIWLIVIIAELNRAPFDFAEGESELVSGFNVEYGAGKFAFIFLSEYGNLIFFSWLTSMIFFQKFIWMLLLILMLLIIRGSFPRTRYDMLMFFSWKMFLPFILILIFLESFLMIYF